MGRSIAYEVAIDFDVSVCDVRLDRFFTTTKDDRVGPAHARKFAARMEEFHEPFFYDEIIEGGHSAGADLKEQAGTDAMLYVYMTQKLMD